MLRSAFSAALLALALAGCAKTPPPQSAAIVQPVERASTVILISVDALRYDYLARGITPNLKALAARGVQSPMRASFPSKTFPNHWTLVTGLRPDHHGIIANAMRDPSGQRPDFTKGTTDPWWWDATTPLWIDAEKAGLRSGVMFWPGSNVVLAGTTAQDVVPFKKDVVSADRVAGVLGWFDRPAAEQPRFVALYLNAVDEAGHKGGPDSEKVNNALREVDSAIGTLIAGLAQRHIVADVVMVSDHGLSAISPSRVIYLDEILGDVPYKAGEWGTYASLNAVPGQEAALENRLLGKHRHSTCWRKNEIPARFEYGKNPRIPAYFCLADPGWLILANAKVTDSDLGDHGYDNRAKDMTASFIAAGPDFRRGKVHEFDNVDVAPLMRDLIGLPPKAGDGNDAPFRGVLRK